MERETKRARIDQLIATVAQHYPERAEDGVELIRRAFGLAQHVPQLAPSALRRGIRAAQMLAAMRVEPHALAATLVAAVMPPAGFSQGEIAGALDDDVARLVEGADRLARVHWIRLQDEAPETLRKVFLAMARDIRVVLIVLGLRVQSMRGLRAVTPDADARQFAAETRAVFAPLANRLGIWQLKCELEDAAFRVLEPEIYGELRRLLVESRGKRQAFIDEVAAVLRQRLQQEGISSTIKGRPKHIYSIHQKMQRKQVTFGEIYDVSALRVTTARLQDCYAVLGLVHSTWAPIPGEFDDYIAMPKGNGYQSLHTAVIGPRGSPVEVQIRTKEMHRRAEFGLAAHWAYKEGRRPKATRQDRYMLLRQLLDWEGAVVDTEPSETADAEQLAEFLKTEILDDQIYVFTPEGDIVDLPRGSTPIDFAYRIHTLIGHRCRGARINDQIVTLDRSLQTGDRVEILTHKQPQPRRGWMNPSLGYLHTAGARAKVRHWFRAQGRESAVRAGHELVQRELLRLDAKNVSGEQIAAELGYAATDELYAALGYGDKRASTVASAALLIERRQTAGDLLESFGVTPQRKPHGPSGVSLDGVSSIQGKRARCCNPLPGDDVVGFVTRGRGVVIHRRDCASIRDTQEPERVVEIDWGCVPDELHSVAIELGARNRSGVLGGLLKLVANLGAHISSAHAQGSRDGEAVLRLGLDFRDASHVARILERLDQHPDVVRVRRIKS